MDQPTNNSTAHAYDFCALGIATCSYCPAPRVSTLVPFIFLAVMNDIHVDLMNCLAHVCSEGGMMHS